jgi:methionyl-tRNA formyltransferase
VVATGDGGLVLVEVQAAGRARQQYTAWAAGARLADGDHLD